MKSCWALGLVLLAVCCGFAQNATRIDGRQHPQLIPDNAAYRTVFLMHSHFETQQATTRSEQFHALIGFTAADHQAYDEVLRDFRQEYDHQVERHNAFRGFRFVFFEHSRNARRGFQYQEISLDAS